MLQLVATLTLVCLATAYPYNSTGTDNSTDTYNSTGTSGGYYANTQPYYDVYNGTASYEYNNTSYENASATSHASGSTSSATLMETRVAKIVENSLVAQLWEAVKDVMSEVTVDEMAAESENVTKAELIGFMTEAFKLSNNVFGLSASKFGGLDQVVNGLLCLDTDHDSQISLNELVSLLMNRIAGPRRGKHPCLKGKRGKKDKRGKRDTRGKKDKQGKKDKRDKKDRSGKKGKRGRRDRSGKKDERGNRGKRGRRDRSGKKDERGNRGKNGRNDKSGKKDRHHSKSA